MLLMPPTMDNPLFPILFNAAFFATLDDQPQVSMRKYAEEMFGDMKRHGFDLEATMLQHARCLSRLILAVALLYVWCIAVVTRTVRAGRRHLVDRKDRRDLSIFQIGLR